MGNFNPNLPYVNGMEWVPLQNGVRVLDIGSEIGYGFTVTGAPNNALANITATPFYPASALAGQTLAYNIYPRGREDDTGEINVVRWPVLTAFVTGAVVSGSSVETALSTTADSGFITFTTSASKLRATFNAPFALTGQRILAVDLVYQAAGTPGFVLEPTIESNTVIYPYGPYITGPASLNQVSELGRIRLGEVNPWWSTAAGPNTEPARLPWRYADMLRWVTGAGGQLYFGIRVNTLPLSGFARLGYLALDIYYCDESRVAYGGTAYGQDPTGALSFTAFSSTSAVTMRDTAFATPVTLAAGDYTVTTTLADAGDKYNAGDKIALPQVFQFAPVSTHPTYEVTKFRRNVGVFPGIPPLAQSTDYMVAATLSTSGSALQTGEAPVPYIIIEGAPVYRTPAGVSIEATQQIHSENNTATTSRPLLRFYARRFNPAGAGSLVVVGPGAGSATITAEEFAALPELTLGEYGEGTGWKQVDLYSLGATVGGGGGFVDVTFLMDSSTAPTSTPIDQYQIMVTRVFSRNTVDGRAFMGTTALPFAVKSRYDGLQNATLTWKTPETVTATTVSDTTSTAIVMFAAEVTPPVTFSAELTSMSVSGVGTSCGVPMCVPSSIYGTRLTWTSTPTTGGFDHYQIERSDTIDTDFQVIAELSGFNTLTFTDWEARVGVQSTYRIRGCLVNDFCATTYTDTTFTLTAPGIGGAGTGNSVLIFTSNHGPTGNLAYIMQFDGAPVEDFVFPEAGFVQLQTQFQRDFFTAHHPTERGGVQFQRTILVQAAAIAAPSLPNFRSLRDLGWAALPYVCVRDELGNRAFATVQIPSGRVHSNRTAYLADITVTEVTDTPAAVVS